MSTLEQGIASVVRRVCRDQDVLDVAFEAHRLQQIYSTDTTREVIARELIRVGIQHRAALRLERQQSINGGHRYF